MKVSKTTLGLMFRDFKFLVFRDEYDVTTRPDLSVGGLAHAIDTARFVKDIMKHCYKNSDGHYVRMISVGEAYTNDY